MNEHAKVGEKNTTKRTWPWVRTLLGVAQLMAILAFEPRIEETPPEMVRLAVGGLCGVWLSIALTCSWLASPGDWTVSLSTVSWYRDLTKRLGIAMPFQMLPTVAITRRVAWITWLAYEVMCIGVVAFAAVTRWAS